MNKRYFIRFVSLLLVVMMSLPTLAFADAQSDYNAAVALANTTKAAYDAAAQAAETAANAAATARAQADTDVKAAVDAAETLRKATAAHAAAQAATSAAATAISDASTNLTNAGSALTTAQGDLTSAASNLSTVLGNPASTEDDIAAAQDQYSNANSAVESAKSAKAAAQKAHDDAVAAHSAAVTAEGTAWTDKTNAAAALPPLEATAAASEAAAAAAEAPVAGLQTAAQTAKTAYEAAEADRLLKAGLLTAADDKTYSGTVITIKAPQSGFWLYSARNTSSSSVVVGANTTLTLSLVVDSKGDPITTPEGQWYAGIYNGKTYYAPKSSIPTTADTDTTTTNLTKNNAYTFTTSASAPTQVYTAVNTTNGLTNPVDKLPARTRVYGTYLEYTLKNPARTLKVVRFQATETIGNIISGRTYYFEASTTTLDDAHKVNTNTTSVVVADLTNGSPGVPYYAKRNANGTVDTTSARGGYISNNPDPAGSTLASDFKGTRITAKYLDGKGLALSYDVAGTPYYIDSKYVISSPDSSSVVDSASDVDMQIQITLPAGQSLVLHYFPDSSKSTRTLTNESTVSDIVLYGKKIYDDNGTLKCYEVQYEGSAYYVFPTSLGALELIEVVANDTLTDKGVWVTIGAKGAAVYNKNVKNAANMNRDRPPAGGLNPGTTWLASYFGGAWYTFVDPLDSKIRYLNSEDFAGTVSTSKLGSARVTFLGKYKKDGTAATAGEITTEQGAIGSGTQTLYFRIVENMDENLTGSVLLKSGTYAVMPVNSSWYSIVYNNLQYYVRASDVAPGSAVEPFANTTDGKTYRVTIGLNGATLYQDSACTTPAISSGTQKLQAGQMVNAKRFTSNVFIVNVGGADCYILASALAHVLDGDDAAYLGADQDTDGIEDIYSGEYDSTYKYEVLSYKVPTGGVWLYHDYVNPAMVLNAGVTIQLTEEIISGVSTGWYKTWYQGKEYFVDKNSFKVAANYVPTAGDNLSITLTRNVTLYTGVFATNANQATKDRLNSGLTKTSGTTLNVKVHSIVTTSGVRSVSWYSTVISGKTYFFPAKDGTNDTVDTTSLFYALDSSNQATALVTRFSFIAGTVNVYRSASASSTYKTITAPVVLYGISYDNDWYKVDYNSQGWYLKKSDVTAAGITPEQVSVTTGATSSTYATVIGNGDAMVFYSPSTNTARKRVGTVIYEPYEENAVWVKSGSIVPAGTSGASHKILQGGAAVLASVYNSGWYTYSEGSATYYFMSKSVSVATGTGSTQSTAVTLSAAVPYYDTTSTYAQSAGNISGTVTLRRVDSTWYSVFHETRGRTVYVKAADLNPTDLAQGTQIASTSVGNTYTITVKDGTVVYADSGLSATNKVIATLKGGTTLTGTLLYNTATKELYYQVKYDNSNSRYIKAKDVRGVKSGDEATELLAAEQSGSTTGVAVGETWYVKLPAGAALYESKDSTSNFLTLTNSGSYQLLKVDASWYSVTYNGKTYYIPASDVETPIDTETGTGTDGSGIAINESFMHTPGGSVNLYGSPDANSSIQSTLPAGTLMRFTKISDTWYECVINGVTYYCMASDLFGTTVIIKNDGITDGVGIITPTVKITATSGSVNLRKQASLSSTIMIRIPINTIVANGGYVVDGNGQVWYKVSYQGKTGYVIGTYVEAVGTAGTNTTLDPTSDIGRGLTVNVSTVNIRSAAGTSNGIVGRLNLGDIVVPTGYQQGPDGMLWYSFQFNSRTVGWIRYDYLAGSVASTMELSGNVAIKAGDTNLRAGAGENFTVYTKLARDTIVTIVGTGYDSDNLLWYRVTVGGLSGYVRYDLVRTLTTDESGGLAGTIISTYTELSTGSTGAAVVALQQQLINTGYLKGTASGTYDSATAAAVSAFQKAKGLTANGVASAATQAALFNTSAVSSGSTQSLTWFSGGEALLSANPNMQVYDINSGTTWNAKYINGANHADVVPASSSDAQKLVGGNITGSYVRRPVIVTIAGTRYAGSMYAVGHGSTNYVSYFSGVMCIHFTGSKTHGTGNVDADHQSAIQTALQYANATGN